MKNLNVEPPPRVPLKISGDETEGKILLGGVDITTDLRRLVIDLSGFDCIATIDLAVDVEFDFPVTKVAQIAGNPLEGLTAKELNEAAAMCPVETTLGEHLLRHLRARGDQSPE